VLFKAALHTHTNSSDGSNPLWSVVEEHYRSGYDILSIHDHNYLTRDWVTARFGITRERFIEIAAGFNRNGRGMLQIPNTNEISWYPDDLNTFFVDNETRPGSISAALQQAQDQGGLVHWNHPGRENRPPAEYASFFMTYGSLVGMEIVNQGDRYGNDRRLWDNVNSVTIPQGRVAWGFSNDDSHGFGQVGFQFNMFQMPENTLDQFRGAMLSGSFYAVSRKAVHEGVENWNLSAPVPVINSVIRNATSITIYAEHFSRIEWVTGGTNVVAEGPTINLPETVGLAQFIRANVIGPGGIAFTQPIDLGPFGYAMGVSEGMRRLSSGRYQRASIETRGLNGVPIAERVSPLPTRFSIALNKSGVPYEYLNSEYGVWIEDMRHYMEQIVIGLRFDPSPTVLDIDFSFRQLDPGILGQCGPGDGTWNPLAYLVDLRLDATNSVATVRHATMAFNTDYFQVNPTTQYHIDWKRIFFRTAVHECMHAFGLGSCWNGPFRIVTAFPVIVLLSSLFPYNIIGTGNPTVPAFTASRGITAWRETMQGQVAAASIPIENTGMTTTTTIVNAGGTALAHWRSNSGGSGPTGILDHRGRDLAAEIMTAWSSANAPDAWVGKFTVASLNDIGWDVSYLPLEVDFWQYKTV